MLEAFLAELAAANSGANILEVSISVAVALILALVVYFTHKFTTDEFEYDKNFGLVIILVPTVVSLLIAVTGTNVVRAFSIAAVLAIVRYRSVTTKPRDLVFIFFGVALGFISGVQLYLGALIFVVIACLAVIIYSVATADKSTNVKKTLKIAVPESINYDGLFDKVLGKYTSKFKLVAVRIISGGTVTELTYNIKMNDVKETKYFLDEIRTLNANFKVSLTEFAIPVEK